MKVQFRHLVLAAALSLPGWLSVTSCSVKEDRRPCPCYLNVEFTDREEYRTRVGVLAWNGSEVFREMIDASEHEPCWEKTVRKGLLTLCAWEGLDRSFMYGNYLMIPPGRQCDSVYSWHGDVDATGDDAHVEVDLLKQFCRVTVDMNRSAEEMELFRFRVDANSCGYSVLDFAPMEGDFYYETGVPAGERLMSFRVPRQLDSQMSLSVWYDGVLAGVFPIGTYIARMGYDWTAAELPDITVSIDMIMAVVNIAVAGWEDGATFKFIEQ